MDTLTKHKVLFADFVQNVICGEGCKRKATWLVCSPDSREIVFSYCLKHSVRALECLIDHRGFIVKEVGD